jgi:hypothetical protein
LLLGFCQELAIHSVLTTQVINWARTSVRECDIGRRLMHHSVRGHVLPKHIDPRLVMFRDESVEEPSVESIVELSEQIRDRNYRIYAAEGEIHVVSAGLHLHNSDPFILMEQLRGADRGGNSSRQLDSAHAFYLGYEMCKASIALALGKTYQQDEALNWGLATRAEARHYLTRARPSQASLGAQDGAT